MNRSAFTIIELLVVLAISALFSTLAITYSSAGRNQIALSVEESKIAQIILQAKSLAISTYTVGGSASCAFGVVFDVADQNYSIFNYSPAGAPPCPSDAALAGISPLDEQKYTAGTWQIPVSSGVKLESGQDNLATVLFYPPNPDVFLSEDNQTFDSPAKTLNVYLKTVDGNSSGTISINPGGQIFFQ